MAHPSHSRIIPCKIWVAMALESFLGWIRSNTCSRLAHTEHWCQWSHSLRGSQCTCAHQHLQQFTIYSVMNLMCVYNPEMHLYEYAKFLYIHKFIWSGSQFDTRPPGMAPKPACCSIPREHVVFEMFFAWWVAGAVHLPKKLPSAKGLQPRKPIWYLSISSTWQTFF